jgi:hypothetical protein
MNESLIQYVLGIPPYFNAVFDASQPASIGVLQSPAPDRILFNSMQREISILDVAFHFVVLRFASSDRFWVLDINFRFLKSILTS